MTGLDSCGRGVGAEVGAGTTASDMGVCARGAGGVGSAFSVLLFLPVHGLLAPATCLPHVRHSSGKHNGSWLPLHSPEATACLLPFSSPFTCVSSSLHA